MRPKSKESQAGSFLSRTVASRRARVQETIPISAFDLGLAAGLVMVLALLTQRLGLGIGKSMAIAALRALIQLSLVGLALKFVFTRSDPLWIAAMALVMILVAGREVIMRQGRRFAGPWGYGLSTFSLFASSFVVTLVTLLVIVEAKPWYEPRYAIPLLGMILGNTMTAIALALDSLTQQAYQHRHMIEARLMLGQSGRNALSQVRRQSLHSAMIPIINAMAAAGVVSLPGMMTGQILAGQAPLEAVRYQILVMFLITIATGLGALVAIWLAERRLFDKRERLRLDHLASAPSD
jgi:UDP-glucose/iron transport system permease protein